MGNKSVGGRHGALDATPGYNEATAVHLSAMNGHTDVVAYLINSGVVDINAQDADGRTALACACADGAEDVVKLMVEEGAEMGIPDLDNYTPLHHAALNGHDNIVKYLLVQTAMQRLAPESYEAPKMRRQLREYRANQSKEDIDSFNIAPPKYGAEGLDQV